MNRREAEVGGEPFLPEDSPLATLLPHPESDPDFLFHPDVQVVPLYGKGSIWYEQYQKLCVGLLSAAKELRISPKVILVTSAVPAEGKTLTAVNLALTLHQAGGHRVLLVEADLRKPRIRSLLRRPPRHGLADILLGKTELEKALEEFRGSGFRILCAGETSEDSVGLLESPRLEETLAKARERYDHIVIDSPPWLPFPDAAILSEKADAVAFVVRMGTTPREDLLKSLENLDRRRLVGIIANDVRNDETPRYYHYYRYKGSHS